MTPRPQLDGLPRVLVVDADDRVRESLSGLLGIGGRCMVVASAGDVTEAFELALGKQPDLVVIDPRLPDLADGIALISRLRARRPDLRILATSWSDSIEADVIDAGADSFLRKTFRPSELVPAVLAATRPIDHPTSESA